MDAVAIGAAELFPYLFILVLVAVWFMPSRFSSEPEHEIKCTAIYAGLSAVVGLLINFIISLFYYHPRPFIEGLGRNLVQHAPDSSFPSDHTTFMLAIATALVVEKSSRPIGVVLYLLGLWGGISRIYIGVHFPMDILVALLVAGVASLAVLKTKKSVPMERSVTAITRWL